MEEKVVFNLKELEREHIKELVDNPGTYGKLVEEIIVHLLNLGSEYSPYGIDFNYEDEFFDFNLVMR